MQEKQDNKKRDERESAGRRISELVADGPCKLQLPRPIKGKGNRVHLLALGDVGATLLLGLKTLGSTVIDTIGIYDVDAATMDRYEMEMNQIGWPFSAERNAADHPSSLARPLPRVVKLTAGELFACDLFVFCASRAVPAIGAKGDVRMAQFAANREIVAHYGKQAGEAGFTGIFAVVSDPVDPLCKEALQAAYGGLAPGQVRGYGLGVMHRRAMYFAAQDPARFGRYAAEGRAYGPHGEDLVIADSVVHYDDAASQALTKLTVEANLRVREKGFKPYYAPAYASGAMSLLMTLTGQWHYSSIYFGSEGAGAFLGIKNRIQGENPEYEDILLPQPLYKRIETAYNHLCEIN